MSGRDTGRFGEEYAAEVLERTGFTVVARNVHSLYGELDLVATGEGCICFVEIKTRKKGAAVSPEESITPEKRRRIITTALLYLQNHPTDLQPRFDLFAVTVEGERIVAHEHLKGAFDTDGY